MKKRFLSFAICVLFLLTAFPFSASAAISYSNTKYYIEANKAAGLDMRVVATNSGSTVKIFLPSTADPSQLKLCWEDPANVTVKNSSGTVCQSGKTSIAANGKSVNYNVRGKDDKRQASVTFRTYVKDVPTDPDHVVADMVLELDENFPDPDTNERCTIERMNSDTEHKKSCYGTVSIDGATYYVNIKGRGNYTWTCAKKPYNFTLYEDSTWDTKADVNLVGNTTSKKWSLLANYADSTLLRNKIGYELAEKMGVGLESRFVDLWMNGEYLGNYLLTAKSDYDVAKKGFIMELDNKPETAIADGGDQFRVKEMAKYTGGGDSVNAFTIKDMGKKLYDGVAADDAEKKALIAEWTQSAVTAAFDSDSEDYLNYFDLDSWAKMYLLQELYKNYDIISGSIMMHRDGTSAEDKLFAGPVWDLDNSMGRGTEGSAKNCLYSGIAENMQHAASGFYIDSIVPNSNNQYNSIFQFLGKHASFMERVYQIYNQYKADFDNLTNRVDYWKVIIKNSKDFNFLRWTITQTSYNNTHFRNDATYNLNDGYAVTYVKTAVYDDYIKNLNTYLSTRARFFADKLAVTAPQITVSGNLILNENETLTLTANGTADSYQWQSSPNGKKQQDIVGATQKTYSQTATSDIDGFYFLCTAKNIGTSLVNTSRVAAVYPSATATAICADAVHVHSYGDTYQSDDSGHWLECSCGDKKQSGKHIYAEAERKNATYTETGSICYKCGICGHTVTETLPQLTWGDADGNGKFDAADVALAKKAVLSGTGYSEAYDANRDGVLDINDVIRIEQIAIENAAPGDANIDGKIDAADLVLMRKKLLSSTGCGKNFDTNGDQVVDVRDLIRLKNHIAEDIASPEKQE